MADGATVTYPASCHYRDFELELGAIVTTAWDTATQGPPKAADVIGAFTVITTSALAICSGPTSAAALQRHPKAKSFATGMAATVVTADEVLRAWIR